MGLAEPRKRLKISHDPNNTQWTTSSITFGRRILRRQGWRPGSGLGARSTNAYAPASTATTIKVTFKDDNLGLGAKSGEQEQSLSGDAFAGLLGRLNGKDEEELAVEERKREKKRLERYVLGKFGSVVFVRGGVLVQTDDFKKSTDVGITVGTDNVEVEERKSTDEKAIKGVAKKEKRRRKEEKIRAKVAQERDSQGASDRAICPGEVMASSRDTRVPEGLDCEERKQRKAKKRRALAQVESTKVSKDATNTSLLQNAGTAANDLPKEKAGKRPFEKLESQNRKVQSSNNKVVERSHRASSTSEHANLPHKQLTVVRTEEAVTRASETNPTTAPVGRHVIRGRYIAQKKAAFLDDSSLKGIFTAKAR